MIGNRSGTRHLNLITPEDDRPARAARAVDGDKAVNPWVLRTALAVLLVLAGLVLWATNIWLSERFSENTRVRAELRATLYSGQLQSELQRNSVVPMMLARDPALISALSSSDFATTSARLITAQKDIGAASIRLLDASGRTVAATDRQLLGTNYVGAPYFVDAMRARATRIRSLRRPKVRASLGQACTQPGSLPSLSSGSQKVHFCTRGSKASSY